ncbi:MAG: hypothetical protein IPG50_25400 [Myxococcales bacterium]|nr:hypothetical protein [Myxococcales bacterium]
MTRSPRPFEISVSLMLGVSLALHAGAFALVGRQWVSPPAATPQASVLTGDTLEVPGLSEQEVVTEVDDLDVVPELHEPAPTNAAGAGEPAPKRRASPPKLRVKGGAATSAAASDDAPAARFGAVGERGAVDLATAFTRGFPQAASSDPIWAGAPFGAAGTLTAVLTLDDGGTLVEARIEGTGSPALRQALSRTVALVRGRTFVARAKTTRLVVVGTVSRDTVKSGAFGDVFAIGGSYVGNAGSAFFSLAIGRRVDVTVTSR